MSHNTWIHRTVRLGVKPLARTPVTPNQLTTVRLLTGVASAGLFAVGGEPWSYYGAALFVLSIFLDRADGELARISGKSSAWGHTYDLVADAICNALVFIGIGIGLHSSAFGWWAVPMGFVAGAAVVAILWLVIRIEDLEGQRSVEFSGAAGFDPDDAMIIVPLAVFFDWTEPLLFAAAVGAPSFAIFAFWYSRLKLRQARGFSDQLP